MNIESLINKIELFEDLVIESGFQRDIQEYINSIAQVQNRNLVFMKDLSEKVAQSFMNFQNNSLNRELEIVLKKDEPFTSINVMNEIEELNSDSEINGNQYFAKFNGLLAKIKNSITSNEKELKELNEVFSRYTYDEDEREADEDKALMSLIFKDLKTTNGLKEFSKVLNRWNRTLLVYHTLLKSESPKEIELVEIQNGSIDVIFNIDVDVAIDLTELIKTGLKVYGAYLMYKSKTAKELISSYMGNKKLIKMEQEREVLLLDNIKESVKQKVIEQHKERLKTDKNIDKSSAVKKAEEISEVVTDHIIKGNEIKLLTAPILEDENEKELSNSLRIETSIVRERYDRLDAKDKKLLLEKYTIVENDEKK